MNVKTAFKTVYLKYLVRAQLNFIYTINLCYKEFAMQKVNPNQGYHKFLKKSKSGFTKAKQI